MQALLPQEPPSAARARGRGRGLGLLRGACRPVRSPPLPSATHVCDTSPEPTPDPAPVASDRPIAYCYTVMPASRTRYAVWLTPSPLRVDFSGSTSAGGLTVPMPAVPGLRRPTRSRHSSGRWAPTLTATASPPLEPRPTLPALLQPQSPSSTATCALPSSPQRTVHICCGRKRLDSAKNIVVSHVGVGL